MGVSQYGIQTKYLGEAYLPGCFPVRKASIQDTHDGIKCLINNCMPLILKHLQIAKIYKSKN